MQNRSDRLLYYICKYTPVELLASYGFNLERFDPELDGYACGDACGETLVHPNLCGYGQAILNAVEDGNVTQLFLVNCCDVCRRVYDILRAQHKLDFLYLMDLPHKKGPAEVKQLRKELLRLNSYLQDITGQNLEEAQARKLWQDGRACAQAGRPKQDHLVLTGAHGNASLKEKIEDLTQLPVLDDTCNGNRELAAEAGEEFFQDYSAALLSQPNPCMRMQFSRPEDPQGLGTICHTIKFCDYYSFQYKNLRGQAEPLLKIETDCTAQSQGQITTRLEAFAEQIKPKIVKKSVGKEAKYVCGIDSGSSSTNAVILDDKKNIVGSSILATGGGAAKSGQQAFSEALAAAGLQKKDISQVITTGYGRNNLQLADSSITEITCHAKGASFLYPQARTVIDIGGQDSKVIVLDAEHNVVNFVMNDKCAAGTGRFLETMAKTLDLSMEDMSVLGLRWKKPVTISSTCTVFAESEVVSLIAQNTALPDIINGLNQSIASKTLSLVKRAKGQAPYIMTGGVASNVGVVQALEKELGENIYVPQEAQLCGALGAALFALE